MKFLKICIMLLAMSGCATLSYDGGQYDRVVRIVELVDSAYPLCSTPELVKPKIDELNELSSHQQQYAKYRSGREREYLASVELGEMINELYTNYKLTKPSSEYCRIKLRHIKTGAVTMLKTLGAF